MVVIELLCVGMISGLAGYLFGRRNRRANLLLPELEVSEGQRLLAAGFELSELAKQQLVIANEPDSIARKLRQLALEEQEKYEALIEPAADKILNHLLTIPTAKFYTVELKDAFPELADRTQNDATVSHVMRRFFEILSRDGSLKATKDTNNSHKFHINW